MSANPYVAPALIFAGVALTAYISWKIAKRQNSGSISTSEAVDLWAESNSLRADYKEQAEKNQLRAEKAEEQLRKNNEQLQEVNLKLQKVIDELVNVKASSAASSELMVKKINELKSIIKKLRAENQRLLARKRGTKK